MIKQLFYHNANNYDPSMVPIVTSVFKRLPKCPKFIFTCYNNTIWNEIDIEAFN